MKNVKQLLIFGIVIFNAAILIGQNLQKSNEQKATNYEQPMYVINWMLPSNATNAELNDKVILPFSGSIHNLEDNFLPRFAHKFALSGKNDFTVTLYDDIFEELSDAELATIENKNILSTSIEIKTSSFIQKKLSFGEFSFIPLRKNKATGKIEKLISFNVLIDETQTSRTLTNITSRVYANHSVLQNGNWFKIAIANDGMYRLDATFFQKLGININLINPKNIRIYGNASGLLPELNSIGRPDDLIENAIYVEGENDNIFDPTDYVLFYAKGPHKWTFNSAATCLKYSHIKHLYSDSSYYFITLDLGPGKRIQPQASSLQTVTHTVTSFDDYAFHELDATNFLKSGRQWFGEYFDNQTSFNFSFPFPNIDLQASASVNVNLASKNANNSSNYSVSCQGGSTVITATLTSGDNFSDYAKIASGCFNFIPNNQTLTVNITKQTANAVAWLDYIEVNARRNLILNGNQLIFRDGISMGAGNVALFNLTSSLLPQIWDVTNPTNAKLQQISTSGNSYSFAIPTDTLHEFVAFSGTNFNKPIYSGKIQNQDLHALSNKQYIIVTHPDFYNEAVQLANFHQNADGLTSAVVTTNQVYNEFSSGVQDISAIRDFVKMFYDKATVSSEMPQYVLLFGDGSYEMRRGSGVASNFVPTYQSVNSTILIASYVSDDFYACLDDAEGILTNTTNAVDVGIGRFPVKNRSEALAAINKIFYYKRTGFQPNLSVNSCTNLTSESTFGDWRNVLCFIADDEDGDLHLRDADTLASRAGRTYKNFNIDKIYLDAYRQESTPGGQRYPDVVDAINRRVDKGCLIMNYTGHGGEVGLGHERIVEVAQINSWKNKNNMPLFFTATCEFSRYDDPDRTSAGEYTFLNPNGAAIALFTTVRLVFASGNFNINKAFYDKAFEPVNGIMPRLGDLYEYMKNQPDGRSTNGRNFSLLGDPALRLNYPKEKVSTDSINGNAVSITATDTLFALSKLTVSGYLRDSNGAILSNFNGVIYPTVYDKVQTITTLSNDGNLSPVTTFKLQKNVLYRGKASVTNGFFKFAFVAPKDILYNYGIGKISYYAEDGNTDASGYYEKIIIGGTNPNALADNVGPENTIYMNDIKFAFGGITDENPDLYAILFDENGINTVGSGIGHDITAVLDGNTEKAVVLNDYYQSDLNNYKKGSIRYPFNNLSEGKHTLKVKAWDVYNNSTDAYTEFIVAKSAELALDHVLNYPNPFTTRTQFYFEQNQCCQMLDVSLQIFTVSGKLVKNISKIVYAEGYRSEPIEWDGKDDFGDKIGRGVYVYKLKVKTNEGKTAEKYEKLVILN
jgi:hypothetical protein